MISFRENFIHITGATKLFCLAQAFIIICSVCQKRMSVIECDIDRLSK